MKTYSRDDLDTLTGALQAKLNTYATMVSGSQRDTFNRKRTLFSSAAAAYKAAAATYPFIEYSPKSVKPSLFSYLGNYLGFQGYYNPFSGEGQVNTTIPRFLEPFVTTHEIAHQVGYARENEANFVAFLACQQYESPAFKYSMYFDMYLYSVGELSRRDSLQARQYQNTVHPQVKKDQQAYRDFLFRHRNPIEEVVMWGYGHFLRANNQPAGKRSYNEVVAWLIAYYKKYGVERL